MSMRCDATMVQWIRKVVWMAATPVVPSGSETQFVVTQVRGHPPCTLSLIIQPPADAVWREGGRWEPGLIIGHNDAAPYNAAWASGRLVGFFDWDLAAPVTQEWDLAFTAFSWVPLHARHVVEGEGFTAFADRPRRLRLFLDSYGWDGQVAEFVSTVQARVAASAEGIRRLLPLVTPPTSACSTLASTHPCVPRSRSSKSSAPTSTSEPLHKPH